MVTKKLINLLIKSCANSIEKHLLKIKNIKKSELVFRCLEILAPLYDYIIILYLGRSYVSHFFDAVHKKEASNP